MLNLLYSYPTFVMAGIDQLRSLPAGQARQIKVWKGLPWSCSRYKTGARLLTLLVSTLSSSGSRGGLFVMSVQAGGVAARAIV